VWSIQVGHLGDGLNAGFRRRFAGRAEARLPSIRREDVFLDTRITAKEFLSL
jgi:hypothetical protein